MTVPPHATQGEYAYPYPPLPVGYASWQTEPIRPGVWPWFVAYCAVMALTYIVCVGAGAFFVLGADRIATAGDDPMQFRIIGAILLAVGLPFAVAFGAAPFLPRRPWVWVYDLVLIVIGLTSACTLPACIPLLIFWIKPEAKAWFGRER